MSIESLSTDPFVFYANAPGLMLSLWLNISAIKLQYSQILHVVEEEAANHRGRITKYRDSSSESDTQSDPGLKDVAQTSPRTSSSEEKFSPSPSAKPLGTVAQEILLYTITLTWLIILSSVGLLPRLEHGMKVNIVGICSNINLIFFFGAPLSSIAVVLQLRSSQPIHRKTLLLNSFNASFWSIYGLSIHDLFILIPNLVGLSLSLLQVLLCVIFPQELFVVQQEQSVQLNEVEMCTETPELSLDHQKGT